MKMRITIVTGPFLPTGGGPSGAVEKIWFGLAKTMADLGHQVTIVARLWPGQMRKEAIGGVCIVRRGGYSRSRSIALDLIKDFFYSVQVLCVAPSADVTVTNTFWLPVIARIRKKTLGRIIVNVARYPKQQMGLYRYVDRFSAVSGAVAEEIVRQTPGLRSLVKTIPNPVDVERFKPTNPPPPGHNSFRVLYTGRVHPEKGLHLLISALKRLLPEFPGIQLAIVGATQTEHGGGGALIWRNCPG
jgi:glycosyltransferase involved in cell wall biosynthesis